MNRFEEPADGPGTPPYAALRAILRPLIESLRTEGHSPVAERFEAALDQWWSDQSDWDARIIELLRLHHDINNALVGVSGNVQLLMRDPLSQQPGVRERLDVMLRESRRIQQSASRLRLLKTAMEGASGESRAA